MTTNTAGEEASAPKAQPYFLIDMIEVRKDRMQDFIINMTLLVPVFEGYDWKLISATYTLTGQPSTVIHVWQIPSADSLRNTMVRMGENTLYLKLQETITAEQQNILSRMPYDPNELTITATPPVSEEDTNPTGGIGIDRPPAPVSPAPASPAPLKELFEQARVPGDLAADKLREAADKLKDAADKILHRK